MSATSALPAVKEKTPTYVIPKRKERKKQLSEKMFLPQPLSGHSLPPTSAYTTVASGGFSRPIMYATYVLIFGLIILIVLVISGVSTTIINIIMAVVVIISIISFAWTKYRPGGQSGDTHSHRRSHHKPPPTIDPKRLAPAALPLLFTVGLITLFSTISPADQSTYAWPILISTLLAGGFAFYRASKSTILKGADLTPTNVAAERIRRMIVLICFLVSLVSYYVADPGGIIHRYFGTYSLVLTIVMGFLAALYLMVLMTVPERPRAYAAAPHFLDLFSRPGVYGILGFLAFVILLTVVLSSSWTTMTPGRIAGSVILGLLICVGWAALLGAQLFPEALGTTSAADGDGRSGLVKRALLAILGLVLSGLFIGSIVFGLQHLATTNSVIQFVLNTILVVIVMALLFRALNIDMPIGNARKTGFLNLLWALVAYVPCLFGDSFTKVGAMLAGKSDGNTAGSLMMLFLGVVLWMGYYGSGWMGHTAKSAASWMEGKHVLLTGPMYLNRAYPAATYLSLHDGKDDPDYRYGLSFWVYLDAAPPNLNASSNEYATILDYGGKPRISYNSAKRTVRITVDKRGPGAREADNQVVFERSGDDVPLQKWINVVVNCHGGTLDVFWEGELAQSNINIVWYSTLDMLQIGQEGGIAGAIRNVNYYPTPLSVPAIYEQNVINAPSYSP